MLLGETERDAFGLMTLVAANNQAGLQFWRSESYAVAKPHHPRRRFASRSDRH